MLVPLRGSELTQLAIRKSDYVFGFGATESERGAIEMYWRELSSVQQKKLLLRANPNLGQAGLCCLVRAKPKIFELIDVFSIGHGTRLVRALREEMLGIE